MLVGEMMMLLDVCPESSMKALNFSSFLDDIRSTLCN